MCETLYISYNSPISICHNTLMLSKLNLAFWYLWYLDPLSEPSSSPARIVHALEAPQQRTVYVTREPVGPPVQVLPPKVAYEIKEVRQGGPREAGIAPSPRQRSQLEPTNSPRPGAITNSPRGGPKNSPQGGPTNSPRGPARSHNSQSPQTWAISVNN